MTERTEREAVAQIVAEARDRPDIMAIHIADIILREHIDPLRAALKEAERERDYARTLTEEAGRLTIAAESRASAREALLAECEAKIKAAFKAGWRVNAIEAGDGEDQQPAEYLDKCEEVDWLEYAKLHARKGDADA
jgi:hypothetical protein